MPFRLDVPGQVSVFQLRAIERVASLVPPGGVVVEVGSLFGRSSWAWGASVHPSVEVHCVDPWEKNAGIRAMERRLGLKYGLDQFVKFTEDLPNIKPRKGYSPDDFKDWTRPIDLYYEDAVHTDPILSRNLEFWTSHLKPRGVICGDDYRPRFPDVRAGAHRLAERFGRQLILVENFWCLLPADVPEAAAVAADLAAIGREADAERRKAGLMVSIGTRMGMPEVIGGQGPVLAMRVANESLDPWPAQGEPEAEVAATLRVRSDAQSNRVVAEMRVPLGVRRLEPDVPVDFDATLPTAALPAGPYSVEFIVCDGQGKPLPTGGEPVRVRFSIQAAPSASVQGAPQSVAPPTPVTSAPSSRTALFDPETVRRDFARMIFADSHGAFEGFLGAGALYYGLAHAVRAQVAVCIGSGGGFVPALLRRAQVDAGFDPSCTYLVDANLPDLAFGSPVQAGGWMTVESDFLKRESDIVALNMLSVDAARLFASSGIAVDYLHIDGDHSMHGVIEDFQSWLPMLSEHAVVTLHDLRLPSVAKAVDWLLAEHPQWQSIGFPEIGAGSLVLRRAPSKTVGRRSQTQAELVDGRRSVRLDEAAARCAVAASQQKAKFERWDYLTSEAYRLRYALVARYLDAEGATIVEVGGFPNSILGFLSRAARVHAIEPYAPDEFVAALDEASRSARVPFFLHRGVLGRASPDLRSLGAYRLVALGLDLTSGADTDAETMYTGLSALVSAMSGAEIVALEIPRYAPSLATFEVLERLVIGKRRIDVTLDLTKDPVADDYYVKDNRAVRRLVVFEPVPGVDVASPVLVDMLRQAADAIASVKKRERAPVEPTYTLGQQIVFSAQGNASAFTREGWVSPEAQHTWTKGTHSRLVLSIDRPRAELDRELGYKLLIEARPLVVQGKQAKQSLVISVNGHQVHAGEYRAAGKIEVHIPAHVLMAQRPVCIDLSHPDCRRPADIIDGSQDRKELAFAIKAMALTVAS